MNLGGLYLAYPIDNAPAASMVGFYQAIDQIKGLLLDFGLVDWSFDPGDAFRVAPGAKPSGDIMRINRQAISLAGLVVAFLPANVPTIGTVLEIERSAQAGKPVLVFTDARSSSAALADMPPNVIEIHNPNLVGAVLHETEKFAKEILLPALGQVEKDATPVKTVLPFVADYEYALMPTRAYADDAGLDLYVSERTVVPALGFQDVPGGISCELPAWAWGLVAGRSSALRRRGLLVYPGIIDSGYRGPLFAGVWNTTGEPVTLEEGERIAQLIIMPNMTKDVTPIQVTELSDSPRGVSGFGSSGD